MFVALVDVFVSSQGAAMALRGYLLEKNTMIDVFMDMGVSVQG